MEEDLRKLTGNRLRQLLNLTGLTQNRFADKYGFSRPMVNGWLMGKTSIYLNTAKKLVDAFRQEGIGCSIDWLLEDEAPLPTIVGKPVPLEYKSKGVHLQEEEFLRQQITSLKKIMPNFVTFHIPNNAMHPMYSQGDYVGGTALFGKEIQILDGSVCILETVYGQKDLRVLHFLQDKDAYEGKSLHEDKYPSLLVPSSKLLLAAKVFWHIVLS